MTFKQDLIGTLKNTELKSLVIDSSELVIDSALDSGVIKDIPVLGSVYKVYSIGSTIRANLFQKQIYAFLYELKNLEPKRRDRLMKKLESKSGFDQSLGEELIIMLDRFANIRKSSIYARLFQQLLFENIDVETFNRFAHILNQIFEGDINNLMTFYNGEEISNHAQISLENIGLIKIERRSAKFLKSIGGFNGRIYEKAKPNELGELFVEMIQ